MKNRRTKINQHQMLLKRVFLAIVSPVLFFGVLEAGCRILNLEVNTGQGPLPEEGFLKFRIVNKKEQIDRDVFIETGPRIRPLSEYSRSNFDNVAAEGVRVLSIGDSSVYGLGVNENETFSYYLQEMLNDGNFDKKIQVFNFGWPGYTSLQGVLFLKKYIKKIRPNIVIAWFGANDGTYAPFFSDSEYLQRKDSILVKIHNYLYTHFTLYRILKDINLLYVRRLVDKSFKNPINTNYKRRRVSPEEFKDNLNEMKNISQANNCKIIFIWHCWFLNGKLVRYSEYKPEAPYLDLYKIYSSSQQEPSTFFVDFCHPSAKGHQIIARTLKDMINSGL